jgi:predicted AAA+ superfamily ATPase
LWEGFAMEQTIQNIRADAEDLYFWALHQNGELDLFWKNGQQRIGFEFKYSDSVQVSKSMIKALELLKLDHLYIVYPGTKQSKLADQITLLPFGKSISINF